MTDPWDIYEEARAAEGEAAKHANDPVLYNAEAVDGAAELLWCHGEAEVDAAIDAGVTAPVALLGGFGSRGQHDPLRPHGEALERVSKHILAVEDGALREELARRLGRHRCWTIDWPKGGVVPQVLMGAIVGAEPWPIEGLHRIRPGLLAALRKRPAPAIMTTGTRASDEVLRLPADGRLMVLLGYPGSGKTSWTKFVAVHTAANHGRRWAVFSPEMQPWELFAASVAECFIGKQFYPRRDTGVQTMDDGEIALAEQWLSDRMTMLVCDAEGQAPTIEWLLERAAAAVLRDGATDILIDPVNEVEQDGKSDRETVFWGRFLQRWKAFSLRYGANIWLVVHPSKPTGQKSGEKKPVPGPYDAAGSAHFANKADIGLTLHTPDTAVNRVQLHIWKSRSGRWAKRGMIAEMDFEPVTGRYSSPIVEGAEPEAADARWG